MRLFRKFKNTIGDQLKKGLSNKECERAIGLGLTIGVFPIMGFSTPMNSLGAYLFKLNMAVVLAANFSIGFLKVLLIYPFLRVGEWMWGAEPLTLNLVQLTQQFFIDWVGTLQEFGLSFIHAMMGWTVCAPVLYLLFCLLAKPIIRSVQIAYRVGMDSYQKLN